MNQIPRYRAFDGKESGRKSGALFYLSAVILLALFLRAFNFNLPSLCTDEITTCWIVSAGTWTETLSRAMETQGQSPLYFLVAKILPTFFSMNEFVLRLPSLLASVFSVFLLFRISMIIFRDWRRSILAALFCAINEDMIHYGLEASPFGLGIMFCLLSMLYMLKIYTAEGKWKLYLPYALFTAAAIFCHYIFFIVAVIQNLFLVLELVRRKIPERFSWGYWLCAQFIILAVFVPVVYLMMSMLSGLEGLAWLKVPSLLGAIKIFILLFNPYALFLLFACFLIFLAFVPEERKSMTFANITRNRYFSLTALWFFVPFILIYAVSELLGISLLGTNSLILCVPALCLLLAEFLFIFKGDILRIAFPSTYVLIYLGLVLIPDLISHGYFTYTETQNWRAANQYVSENIQPGDIILLRTGSLAENCLPTSDNSMIRQYVRSPFDIFYWRSDTKPEIENLTYTSEAEFFPYYERIFQKALEHGRIWVVGIDSPGSNYQLASVPAHLEKQYYLTTLNFIDFSGVSVYLMSTKYAIRPEEKAE